MRLSKNSAVSIVVPKKATSRESFACEELKKYLLMIFEGISVEITDSPLHGASIIIGGPEHNEAAARYISEEAFDKAVPGPEGMMIKSFGDDVILIAGSSKNPNECERGTIYGVYEFLERFLGCSLSAYINPGVAGGEFVPSLDEKELRGVEYIKPQADLKYRTAIIQYADAAGNPVHEFNIPFADWLVKNRYNRILTWSSVYESYKKEGMLEEAERRGLRFTVGHHESSQLFLPPHGNEYFPEHYEETHPEFYKLKANGERFKVDGFYGQWIFCSRNRRLIETVSNNIIDWIYKNPSVDIVAFWPQDGVDEQCACEKCSKHSKVSNYTFFLNEVAKRVSAVHPNVKIDMLVYVDLWNCPDGQKLEPSLIVDEATWHSKGLRNAGNPDGSGIIGTVCEDLMKWHKVGAEVVYYDYYMGVYPARQRYIPIADEVQALCRHYVKEGVLGTATQIECFNLWNHIFNFFTFARTAYDTELSMEDNLKVFSRIFGAAAPYVEEIIRMAESCLDGRATIMNAGIYLMEHIDREKVYALYEKALDSADSAAARNNVRMMRMEFRYTDVEVEENRKKDPEEPYASLRKYEDPTGELAFMTRFDSFKHNDPGYGITIPVDCEDKGFVPDRWYSFE